MVVIEEMTTRESIGRCYPVIAQLRPHLDVGKFVERVQEQRANQQYHFVAAIREGAPVAVAGYRFGLNLADGPFLYVDDLVTDEAHRGSGYGGILLDWLVAEARRQGCSVFQLDSGVHRFAAHRFYLTKRMDITSHHFAMKL